MDDTQVDQPIEDFVREIFERNYEELRLETGKSIAPDVKNTALNQVLLYWQKLREIAENVTDTEVRLSLPGRETPCERQYTIEGVVDILRAEDKVIMYDIKTHDADYVRANLEFYEEQLNVYAHIWHKLRQQPLDEMAIIATDYPEYVKDALNSGDPRHLAYALEQWQPVVPMSYDERRVEETIEEFGRVVDQIEDKEYAPRTLQDLMERMPGSVNILFATRVCRNCDARFSCSSYRVYAWQGKRALAEHAMKQYYGDFPPDPDQEAWRTAGLDAIPDVNSLRADFGR